MADPHTTTTDIAVTLKLYASLGAYLPAGAERNMASVTVAEGTTIDMLLDRHQVPKAMRHLVLVNGIFVPPAARAAKALQPGDALAVWPPVAGG
ncbi:MAG: MoaD/ThiS family protein [Hyphomicrobiaceae bacterium]|nr:MoaD/ThiS family protein [Hyphomicrobiaceae bacterium]